MRLQQLFEYRIRVIDKLRPYADDADAHISFSNVEKLGINPQSEWTDPYAIYTYPVREILPQLEQKMIPWAGTRPYVYLLKATGNIVELQDINEAEADLRIEKIISKFRPFLMSKEGVDDPEEWFYTLLESWMRNYGSTGGEMLWNIPGRMASYIERNVSGRDIRMLWNSMYRSIGIDGVVDRGDSIVSLNEPAQGVFFSTKAFRVIELLHNNLGSRDA
jgi:hypothetical protein